MEVRLCVNDKIVYKFEGVVKSFPTEEGFEFLIVPTSKYKVTSSVCGKNEDAYVAFGNGQTHPKVVTIKEKSLRVNGSLLQDRTYQWLCSHSDNDSLGVFMVSNKGKLILP